MPDLFDRASELEEQQRQRALSAHAAIRQPAQDKDAQGRVWCIDCGVQVSPKRLVLLPSAPRCVDCQEIAELRSRHGMA
ncbi:TraR/DksA family transcriptional regulator [Gallaecimonas xiamenensis]|uniref:C4-type zinc finger DksA/TraR family protein n=1 Tax=Gallaecimonas xiamenensis 3-C-1 TaxID=745411 RepID=K2IXQ0_9GAMM|nr:TraR/DksA family transcriptional regulator [Gallaecimonas xiamenensis]EKE75201.1 C4-type zinc finger DksA/TraR family protein [Gallaecimonas xiamenensis 3-C-1]